MEPRNQNKIRFEIEKLEERIAPAHVDLPLPTPTDASGNPPPGITTAADHNQHFSGSFRDKGSHFVLNVDWGDG